MPRLRVSAGTSLTSLVPITVNSDAPSFISSDDFEGQVAVYMKGIGDESGRVVKEQSRYFELRKGVTWSIQVQGRFLQPRNADDVLFGNIFERPLKLPWVFGAALRFMNYIDPTLEHDLASKSKPWALSPLIATMPHMVHTPLASSSSSLSGRNGSNSNSGSRSASGSSLNSGSGEYEIPQFPARKPIVDDISRLMMRSLNCKTKEGKKKVVVPKRRAHYAVEQHRREVVFGPEDMLTTDFCYDFLQFSANGGIGLKLPGGISIDLLRYWDGQPVRFVCCERATTSSGAISQQQHQQQSQTQIYTQTGTQGQTKDPWGKILWCVVIESADDAAFAEKVI